MKTLITDKKKLYILIVGILIAIFLVIPYFASNRYFYDMDTAIQWKKKGKSAVKLTTVVTDNATVYFELGDYNTIQAYNFDTKKINNKTLYRVGDKTGIVIDEANMEKMHTAYNGSKEQIAYGIGEKLAQECTAKTGKMPTFVPFEHNGKQYVLWYIISKDGLPELPEFIMDGVAFNERVSAENIVVIVVLIISLFIIGAIICWKLRLLKNYRR